MKMFQKISAKSSAIKTASAIREEIEQARSAMDFANNNFQNALDPDLIDCYIYESNAAWKKYRFLIRQAKLL